ncbi:MAG: hypothetical protein R3D98_12645 [Candidatus Krumholzibacteriia bacterium]
MDPRRRDAQRPDQEVDARRGTWPSSSWMAQMQGMSALARVG